VNSPIPLERFHASKGDALGGEGRRVAHPVGVIWRLRFDGSAPEVRPCDDATRNNNGGFTQTN